MFHAIRQSIESILPQAQPENKALLFNRLCRGIDNTEANERAHKDATLQSLLENYSQDTLTLYKQAFKGWQSFLASQPDVLFFTMKLTSPMVVGKGDQNVHEFGITLQTPFGTPVIPGSAIKGVMSTFAHDQGGSAWQKGVLSSFAGKLSLIMFGGMSEQNELFAGALDFLDAWWLPNSKSPFGKDIINVHNRSWYQAGDNHAQDNWPDGMDSPIPNHFTVVTTGEVFLFAVRGAESWRKLAKEMMLQAGSEYGFGAKTRVGYGRFEYLESEQDIIQSLSGKDDGELAGLFNRYKLIPLFHNAFQAEADRRECSPLLKTLMGKFRPDKKICNDFASSTNWNDLHTFVVNPENKELLQDLNVARVLLERGQEFIGQAKKEKKQEWIIRLNEWLEPSGLSLNTAIAPKTSSLSESEQEMIDRIDSWKNFGDYLSVKDEVLNTATLQVALALEKCLKKWDCKKNKKQSKSEAWNEVQVLLKKIREQQ